MRLALYFQYYHTPDCGASGRHYTFLKEATQFSEIDVVSGGSWRRARLSRRYPWGPPPVHIHEVGGRYHNAMGTARRLVAYGHYALGAAVRGRRLPRPDVILGTSTPLSAAWAAQQVARHHRVPWVFEVRDLWPDFPVQMGALPFAPLRRALYRLERRLYHDAAHVVTLSPDMERHVLGCGVPPERVTTIVNGTDLDLAAQASPGEAEALRRLHGLEGQRVVLYAGMFGRANAIPTLLATARRLRDRRDLTFVFIGDGYHAATIREAAETAPNVRMLPPVPHHAVFAWFRLAELSLVSFIDLPVLRANSPAKLFDSLAVGTPVVVTNAGWTKELVERHGCGWYVPPERADLLATCLTDVLAAPEALREVGRRGAVLAQQRFDRRRLAGQMEDVLVRAAAGAASSDRYSDTSRAPTTSHRYSGAASRAALDISP